jgi:hypothetical protein
MCIGKGIETTFNSDPYLGDSNQLELYLDKKKYKKAVRPTLTYISKYTN